MSSHARSSLLKKIGSQLAGLGFRETPKRVANKLRSAPLPLHKSLFTGSYFHTVPPSLKLKAIKI
jgi:GTP cyclohydrolase I